MPVIRANSLNPTQLLTTAQELSNSLQAIQPDNSQVSKTITFALVATAIIGVFIYHYISAQEASKAKENN